MTLLLAYLTIGFISLLVFSRKELWRPKTRLDWLRGAGVVAGWPLVGMCVLFMVGLCAFLSATIEEPQIPAKWRSKGRS